MDKTPDTAAAPKGRRDDQTHTAEAVDEMLDIALEGTFPASDPVAISSVADTSKRETGPR